MTGKNWLSSSSFEKGEIIDEGNEIDINVMEQESFPMEISADSSLKSFPSSSIQSDFRIKSTKLGMSSIAIAEKDDPKKFRIYRPLNCGPSESMIYYRCSKCELLEKKAFDGVKTKRYQPYVKTLHGKLIGNPYPEHHPNCHTVTKEIQEMQEMDRACRAKIRGNFLSRESPEKLEPLKSKATFNHQKLCSERSENFSSTISKEKQIVEDNSNIDVHSGYNLRRRPRRLSFKFNALSNDINESGLSEVDYLLRQVLKKWFISDACLNDISDTADFRSIYSIGTSSSNNISYSSLIVPELDGMSVRIYDGDGKLTNQRVTHYHCARCDDFYQKRDDESLRVILKAENDLVVNYPVHHPECSPTSLESLRELGDKLKDFSVVANHRIIPLRTVLESEYSIFHEPNESFFTGGSNEQNWNTADMDDEMLISSMSVPKPQEHQCFCKRLYEENVELYQEMLRSVDEMRSLVSEMKRVSGANAEYYIEDEQVLEESDNNTLYVVDE